MILEESHCTIECKMLSITHVLFSDDLLLTWSVSNEYFTFLLRKYTQFSVTGFGTL